MPPTNDPPEATPESASTWSTDALASLLSILDLEQLEHNLFRGRGPTQGWQRVFGGQVIGQALTAAVRTVEDRSVHSLHAYFLLPGDPATPIIYDVDRIRDGRSFTTRRVIAIQHGRAIFSLSASFHNNEDSFDHQSEMPDVPHADTLPSEEELKRQFIGDLPAHMKTYWQRERPIELRPVDLSRFTGDSNREPQQYIWMRATGRLPDESRLHQCVLAYASDFTLLDTALIAHGKAATRDYGRERGVELWSFDPVHLLIDSRDPMFATGLAQLHQIGADVYFAPVGDGIYLVAELLQGISEARRRFPDLALRSTRDGEAVGATLREIERERRAAPPDVP